MTRQKESRLSSNIMKALRAKGVFCFKVHGSALMTAGLPDIIACVDGMFLGLETKQLGKEGNTSPRQDFVHGQIRESGGLCFVVSSVHEALAAVKAVQDELDELSKCHYCD